MTFFIYLKSMHNLKVPYLFFIKSTSALQGETLGGMYPFFNNSSNYICSSLNYGPLIVYGVLDIGVGPNIKSIEKYISLFGGKPSISSKTYAYHCNTINSSKLGILQLASSSTWVACNWHPFLKHLLISKDEISLREIGLGIPSIVFCFPSSSRQVKILL